MLHTIILEQKKTSPCLSRIVTTADANTYFLWNSVTENKFQCFQCLEYNCVTKRQNVKRTQE